MAFGVDNILYTQSLTGAKAQVSGNIADLRASIGTFCFELLGSGTNAGFGNSAIVEVQHSLDQTNWLTLTTLTASGTGTFTQTWYSAGAYSFVRANTKLVYSGATGTGVIYGNIFANNHG